MSDLRGQILLDMKRRLTPNQKLTLIALRLNESGLDRYELQAAVGYLKKDRRQMQRVLDYLVVSGLVARAKRGKVADFFTLGPSS